MRASGLTRNAVVQFLDTLTERSLLVEREHANRDSLFDSLMPLAWLRRTFAAEGRP